MISANTDTFYTVFINDIFYLIKEVFICIFADRNSVEDNFKEVKSILKRNLELL